MIMSAHNHYIVFAAFGLCLHFVFASAHPLNAHSYRDCDWTLCSGPLWYYKEIGCTPIFENTTSCCPTRYDCSIWETSPKDTCPVNDRVYQNGEKIKTEDIRDFCESCTCRGGSVDCTMKPCDRRRDPTESNDRMVSYYPVPNPPVSCCIHDSFVWLDGIIADGNCIYHGISYRYGQHFIPKEDPEKLCLCGHNYMGENNINFCIKRKLPWCGNVLRYSSSIRAHCAPVYDHDKSPQVDCNFNDFECPEENENYVMQRPGDIEVSASVASESENPDKRCKFGKLTMRIGEEFSSFSRYWDQDFRCTCEIPPVPTCRFSAEDD